MESAITIALWLAAFYVIYNVTKFLAVLALKKTDAWYYAKGKAMARKAIAGDVPLSEIRLFARIKLDMTESQLKAFNLGVDKMDGDE